MEKKHRQHEEWLAIEELVIEHKKGNKKATEELIKKFENYFSKYIALIKHCRYDSYDREIRFLISLFVPKDQYIKSRKPYRDQETNSKIFSALKSINMKFECIPEEDLKHELYVIFLRLLDRYQPNGKLFGSYLCTAFIFELSRYIKKIIKNPITFENNIHYNDMFNTCNSGDDFIIRNSTEFDEILNCYDEVDFDDSWVLGISCSEEFLCLTPLERIILVKYYIEGMNDREIANAIGINRNIANQKRRTALEKIKKKFKDKGV